MNGIKPGDRCVVTHDIGNAFREGEEVEVEDVSPDSQRPDYKYVVFSRTELKRYRLSDNDLVIEQPPAMPPEAAMAPTMVEGPPVPPQGERGGGGNTGKTIGIVVLILLLVAAAVLVTLYFVVWRDTTPTEEPVVTTPATQPQPDRTSPEPAERKYDTVLVSREAYDQVQAGMDYSQVVSIFGGPGKQISEKGSPGQPGHEVRYAWDGVPEDSSVFCTFLDDKLTEKSNEGL